MLEHDLHGQGAPLTLLHGFSQRRWSWDEQMELGADAGHRVLTVDLPGHGGSPDAPAASMAAATEAVLELWDEAGWARVHLAGYSLGGRLALYIAAHHPQRIASLVAVSAHAGLPEAARPERRRVDEELAARIEERGLAWFSQRWAALPLFAGLARRGPDFLAELDRMRRTNRPAGLAASLRGMGAAATAPFRDRLAGIGAPTLLVAGQEDGKYVAMAQGLRQEIPNARLAIVPGAGHSVHLERPREFASLLQAHLRAASDHR